MARVFAVDVPVASPPEHVRAWWTDGPPRDREFAATFPGPLGMKVRVRETFRVRPDGSWGFETRAPFGIDVRDDFRAEAAPGGSVVRVRCVVSGRSLLGRLAVPFYAPMARRQFERQWREMARACERDVSPQR